MVWGRGEIETTTHDAVFSCIAVLFALLGGLGKLKPFSLSLGFLGFAGGGKWFGVE